MLGTAEWRNNIIIMAEITGKRQGEKAVNASKLKSVKLERDTSTDISGWIYFIKIIVLSFINFIVFKDLYNINFKIYKINRETLK